MSLSLAGTSLNDLFSDSIARLVQPWSPVDREPASDVTLLAQQVVKILANTESLPMSLTETTLYDLFRGQVGLLRDRMWEPSPTIESLPVKFC